MAEEKKFATGFSVKRSDKAPDYVVVNLSLKLNEAIGFLKENVTPSGWINLKINKSAKGNYYVELDTFIPNNEKTGSRSTCAPQLKAPVMQPDNDDLPF